MLRAALAVLILILGGGIIAAADRPVIRYGSAQVAAADRRYDSDQNAVECAAHQILHLPPETNVLVVGSSRIQLGVSSEQFQGVLGEAHPVYNIGRPGMSTARSYVILRDLYARGYRPEIVVMESALDLLRGAYGMGKDWPWNQDTASVFTFADLLDFPATASDAGSVGHLGLIYYGFSRKVTGFTSRFLAGEVVESDLNATAPETGCILPQFDNPSPKSIRRHNKAKARAKARNEASIGDIASGIVDDRFTFGESGAQRLEMYYLEKVRALTQAHGTQLFVVRPPIYSRPPYSEMVIRQITELVPEALIPPALVIRKTNENFIDDTHLGPEARAVYTDWLARAIRERLGNT